MEFRQINDNYQDFFKILPIDWQDDIVPIWDDYVDVPKIFVLTDFSKIVAGGIVFNSAPPNRTEFEIVEGEPYLAKGYHYIGFLFVDPDRRNEALGTRWLTALKHQFPDQCFWLTIEEEALKNFYIKNGFVCVAQSAMGDSPEWMLIYETA